MSGLSERDFENLQEIFANFAEESGFRLIEGRSPQAVSEFMRVSATGTVSLFGRDAVIAPLARALTNHNLNPKHRSLSGRAAVEVSAQNVEAYLPELLAITRSNTLQPNA